MISRKQREISQRHELILDKSRQLFIEHGYHSVTMDMIAKEMEYSKGTIYKHFDCKESIVTSLCIRFCTLIHKLISCVGEQDDLNPRLQILLIQEAFILLQEKCQDDVQIKNLSDSQPFCTKVSDELSSRSGEIDLQTFTVVVKIVSQAIEIDQLKLSIRTSAEDVAIGCWALAHGIYMLASSHGCSSTFKLGEPKDLLRKNSDLFLDGVGWKKYNLTEKRMQFINEFSKKFIMIINEYLLSTTTVQEQVR